MWLKALVLIALALAAGLAVAMAYGASRWQASTRQLQARLAAARLPMPPQTVDFRELEGLPAPVQRYFRTVLREGQPLVASARAQHSGTFNMGQTTDQWKAFTSDQQVVTWRQGFVWSARIKMLPGLPVWVHDAYLAGEGILHATLFGLFSLVNQRGTDEVAEGEFMRFFAEAVWYPTALLPSQGARWEAVDHRAARGTFTDGTRTLTMLFTFTDQGLVDSVRAEARGRMVDSKVIPTPWQGRFWNYEAHAGMRVPLDGEVAWLLPEGAKPYWRGHITNLVYEFAQSD